jgi:hypothetical protein
MNPQRLDRFTVSELAVDELGSWLDANPAKERQEVRDACWTVSQWLRSHLTAAQPTDDRFDRFLRIRKQLTELFPLDDTDQR